MRGDILVLPTTTGGVVFSPGASPTAGASPIASDSPFSRARAIALQVTAEHSQQCSVVGQVKFYSWYWAGGGGVAGTGLACTGLGGGGYSRKKQSPVLVCLLLEGGEHLSLFCLKPPARVGVWWGEGVMGCECDGVWV